MKNFSQTKDSIICGFDYSIYGVHPTEAASVCAFIACIFFLSRLYGSARLRSLFNAPFLLIAGSNHWQCFLASLHFYLDKHSFSPLSIMREIWETDFYGKDLDNAIRHMRRALDLSSEMIARMDVIYVLFKPAFGILYSAIIIIIVIKILVRALAELAIEVLCRRPEICPHMYPDMLSRMSSSRFLIMYYYDYFDHFKYRVGLPWYVWAIQSFTYYSALAVSFMLLVRYVWEESGSETHVKAVFVIVWVIAVIYFWIYDDRK